MVDGPEQNESHREREKESDRQGERVREKHFYTAKYARFFPGMVHTFTLTKVIYRFCRDTKQVVSKIKNILAFLHL